MIERLQSYYGFTKTPFGREIPAPDLHKIASQQEAIARITWCVGERGIAILTGEVGSGKSVAIRAAITTLDPSRHTTIYIGNPAVGGAGIYTAIATALGAIPRHHKFALIPQTMDLLAAEEHERQRLTILVVDEAHLLDNNQLEDLRLLTNAEMDSHSPLALILVGQPTLRRRVKLGVFAALDQRITTRCHIDGMDYTDTKTYITHHLRLAGRTEPLFSDDAVALIHKHSRGLPRAVNNLATHALIAGLVAGKTIIDVAAARQAVTEDTEE